MGKSTKKKATTPEKINRANLQLSTGNLKPLFDPRLALNEFHSWMYAAARKNAEARAAVPLRMYVKNTAGAKSLILKGNDIKRVSRSTHAYLAGDRQHRPCKSVCTKAAQFRNDYVEVTYEHPVLKTLCDVNPYSNGYDFAFLRHLYLELGGEAFIHPIMGTTGPTQLYSLFPPRIEIVPAENPGDDLIKGYRYGVTEKIFFAPEEVIFFKVSDPQDPRALRGSGCVRACWDAIKSLDAISDYDYHLYANYGRADLAILYDKDVDEAALDRQDLYLSQQLRKKNRSERHLTLAGVKAIQNLNFEPKNFPARDEVIEVIASCFNVPMPLLKGNDAILSNLENAIKLWREIGIQPALVRDEETLNASYLPLFGEELAANSFLAYDNVLPEDEELQRDTMIALVNAGIMTVDEARAELGMEPIGAN